MTAAPESQRRAVAERPEVHLGQPDVRIDAGTDGYVEDVKVIVGQNAKAARIASVIGELEALIGGACEGDFVRVDDQIEWPEALADAEEPGAVLAIGGSVARLKPGQHVGEAWVEAGPI